MDITYIIEKYLPKRFKKHILNMDKNILSTINEIRLRVDKPICLKNHLQDYFINDCVITSKDISQTLDLISDYSIYAYNHKLAQGYITIKGGCRVGVGGSVIWEDNDIKGFSSISSLNIRIPRQVIGCADEILNILKEFENTLIISPPGCGKTTLLRDMVRKLSNKKYNISLIDERSEISFLCNGAFENDIGIRTDVIDGCNKSKGIIMALRSLAPEIIAVDEIGSIEDINAITTAINCGVKILCTIHGKNLEDLCSRQDIKHLIDNRLFNNYIFLKNGNVGKTDCILNKELEIIWQSS